MDGDIVRSEPLGATGPYRAASVDRIGVTLGFQPIPNDAWDQFLNSKDIELNGFNLSREGVETPPWVYGVADSNQVLYFNADLKQFVRVQKHEMTFVRMDHGDEWGVVLKGAREAWEAFHEKLGADRVSTISVEYAYSLSIPLDMPLYHFFNVYVALPDRDALLNSLVIFLTRPLESIRGQHRLLMTGGALINGRATMYLVNTFIVKVPASATAWEILPQITEAKDSVFESQITDTFRGLP